MKAAGGPQKLRFTIHACSGEVCCAGRLQALGRCHCFQFILCSSAKFGWLCGRIRTIQYENCSSTVRKREDGSRQGACQAAGLAPCLHARALPDEGHPVTACRFCKYPQEIVLRLEHTCKIQQIQILSHEYKVCNVRGGGRVEHARVERLQLPVFPPHVGDSIGSVAFYWTNVAAFSGVVHPSSLSAPTGAVQSLWHADCHPGGGLRGYPAEPPGHGP